jgi:HPt (histidine-containing phosphotransfer) domain-containing protein
MNGFLAKPYTLPSLQAALVRWLGGAASATSDAAPDSRLPPESAARATAPAINPRAIAALRDLDEPGGTDLVSHLVRSFLNSADANLERVAAAVADGSARALTQAAHALKSSAANLGAENLAACYRELESCGRQGRMEDAAGLLESARCEQHRALVELRALLKDGA